MEAWQSDHRQKLYQDASASSPFDAAYLLWRSRQWLNSVEQVEDGPGFPPLPEGDIISLMPEIVRRSHVSRVYERENLEHSQTMKRIAHCHPDVSLEERLVALKAAVRMDQEFPNNYLNLRNNSTGTESECLEIAFKITMEENPGFSASSYRQAQHDVLRAIL